MEPRDRAAEAVSAPTTGSRFRRRLLAACVLLAGLRPRSQSPGLLVADTKFDLAVAPVRFLVARRTSGTASGAFGQLQNQAYGYLWPMGPFFALGGAAGPARVGGPAALDGPGHVRRLRRRRPSWPRASGCAPTCACLLGGLRVRAVAADAHRRSGRSRSRSGRARWRRGCCCRWSRLAGGARRGGPPRCRRWRSPWWAASTPPPRSRSSRSARCGCSPATPGSAPSVDDAVVAGLHRCWRTLWWLVPLFLLGSYSPPFLDFIESAAHHHLPDHALRRAAGHVRLGAVRRPERRGPATT